MASEYFFLKLLWLLYQALPTKSVKYLLNDNCASFVIREIANQIVRTSVWSTKFKGRQVTKCTQCRLSTFVFLLLHCM